jgi:hypothetical protein
MASVSRQIGWSQESNLLYQILNQITKLTAVVFALKPKYKVYTALLTQTGSDDPQSLDGSGTLTIGVTYKIESNDSDTVDFTNVGAPNNNEGTYFIATGTTPNSWGDNSDGQLIYNNGAPVAIVLENTIGNIWFEYRNAGEYRVNSNSLFTEDKTAVDIDAFSWSNISNYSFITNETLFPENYFNITSTISGAPNDDLLVKNRLEIKVYN